MKKAEDSDALVFHIYEWAGKEGTVELKVPHGATGATETNLMEQPKEKRSTSTTIASMLPFIL